MANSLKIRKNDEVVVITGKGRLSRTPRRVLAVFPKDNMLLVEGVKMVKKHVKPNPQRNIKGGIAEQESRIHASNVMLWDPAANKPVRRRSR